MRSGEGAVGWRQEKKPQEPTNNFYILAERSFRLSGAFLMQIESFRRLKGSSMALANGLSISISGEQQ